MIRLLVIIISTTLLSSCTKEIEVGIISQEPVVEMVVEQKTEEKPLIKDAKEEDKIELSGDSPREISKKFIVDKDIISYQVEPIMIAVIAPMSGQYDMLGNAIMDGAHMGLIDLFNKHKIPVRLTAIDIGSKIEDMEFSISKLDESQFDIIIGLTTEAQRSFVEAYIAHMEKKPMIMSFLEGDCSISPKDQIGLISSKLIYVILPKGEEISRWQGDNIKIMHYAIDNLKQTNDDLMQITQKIEEETRENQAVVVFTEGNWKLQKFIANLDMLKINNRVDVVLASLSQQNARMETVNQKRHRFGNIGVISFDSPDYDHFINGFYKTHNRKPLDIAFLAYNTVLSLVGFDKNNDRFDLNSISCKPDIKLFNNNQS